MCQLRHQKILVHCYLWSEYIEILWRGSMGLHYLFLHLDLVTVVTRQWCAKRTCIFLQL